MATAPTVLAGGLVTANARPAAAAADQALRFYATRARNTLPLNPPVGTHFALYIDLFDPETNARIGDGSVLGTVVDLTTDLPPKIVTHEKAVFRLMGRGEIHISTMHLRVLPAKDVHPVAIVGGTGEFRTARGDGTLRFVTKDRTDIALNVAT
jgi:hypothetical protein